MPFNLVEAWREEQTERKQIEDFLRRSGETPQSIQRLVLKAKAPPPIESKPKEVR